jgi:hypothetical protein
VADGPPEPEEVPFYRVVIQAPDPAGPTSLEPEERSTLTTMVVPERSIRVTLPTPPGEDEP